MSCEITEWGFIIAKNEKCNPLIVSVSQDPDKDSLRSTVNRLKKVYEKVNLFMVAHEDQVSTNFHGVAWRDRPTIEINVNEKKVKVLKLF
jgi:hypothetical protein